MKTRDDKRGTFFSDVKTLKQCQSLDFPVRDLSRRERERNGASPGTYVFFWKRRKKITTDNNEVMARNAVVRHFFFPKRLLVGKVE